MSSETEAAKTTEAPGTPGEPAGASEPKPALGMEAILAAILEANKTTQSAITGLVDEFRASRRPPPRAYSAVPPAKPGDMPVGGPGMPPSNWDLPPGIDEPMSFIGYQANIICSKEGTVKAGSTEITEVTKWVFKPQVNLQEYASNKTNGYKRRVCGSYSATVTLNGKWDRNSPLPFIEGSAVIFNLYMDASRYIAVASIVKTLTLTVDFDNNAVEEWDAEADSDGQWQYFVSGGGS